jgi:subtilisin family serine protease
VPANQHPAKVLNLSKSGFGSCTASYQAAIDSARSRGAAVVVAAGNNNGFNLEAYWVAGDFGSGCALSIHKH